MKISRALAQISLAAALLTTGVPGALAQDEGSTAQQRLDELEALAQESLERLMLALEGMLQAVPQFELPEINEDGDIIIRRIRPKPSEGTLDSDDMDET